jgi:hypothetical protein
VPAYRTGRPTTDPCGHRTPPNGPNLPPKLSSSAEKHNDTSARSERSNGGWHHSAKCHGIPVSITPPNDADSNLACSQVDGLEPGV